jgi:hypothetical protein
MKKIALCYDFDGTLCSGYMQDQKLLHDCKIEPKDFWIKVANYARKNHCDPTLAYLMLLEQQMRSAGRIHAHIKICLKVVFCEFRFF